jgi:hypothetical protein
MTSTAERDYVLGTHDEELARLVELGRVDPAWAQSVQQEFRAAEADPDTLMITPMVLEIIAERGTHDE